MTYPSDEQHEHKQDPAAGPAVRLYRVLTNSIYTLSLHPVAVLVCLAVFCVLGQITIGLHELIAGGPLPDDPSLRDATRFGGVLLGILVLRVPIDALVDACVLGAVHAMRRGARISKQLLADYVRDFIVRMFIINAVMLGITVMACMMCSPLLFLSAWYVRFVAVYVVAEDVQVGEAFSRSTSIMLDPRSRFLMIYMPATALLIVIGFLMSETPPGARNTIITVLGDAIIGYADLVLLCTAFYLFDHAKKTQVQDDEY